MGKFVYLKTYTVAQAVEEVWVQFVAFKQIVGSVKWFVSFNPVRNFGNCSFLCLGDVIVDICLLIRRFADKNRTGKVGAVVLESGTKIEEQRIV